MVNVYLDLEGRCSSVRWLLPNVISGRGMPRDACMVSDSAALEMGFVEEVMNQLWTSMERELGDSRSLWIGTAIAGDAMVFW